MKANKNNEKNKTKLRLSADKWMDWNGWWKKEWKKEKEKVYQIKSENFDC